MERGETPPPMGALQRMKVAAHQQTTEAIERDRGFPLTPTENQNDWQDNRSPPVPSLRYAAEEAYNRYSPPVPALRLGTDKEHSNSSPRGVTNVKIVDNGHDAPSPPIPTLMKNGAGSESARSNEGFGNQDDADVPHWERAPRAPSTKKPAQRGRLKVRTTKAMQMRKEMNEGRNESLPRATKKVGQREASVPNRRNEVKGAKLAKSSQKAQGFSRSFSPDVYADEDPPPERRFVSDSPPIPALMKKRNGGVDIESGTQESGSPRWDGGPPVQSPPIPALVNKGSRDVGVEEGHPDEDVPHWERGPQTDSPPIPTLMKNETEGMDNDVPHWERQPRAVQSEKKERGRLKVRTNKTLQMRKNISESKNDSLPRPTKKQPPPRVNKKDNYGKHGLNLSENTILHLDNLNGFKMICIFLFEVVYTKKGFECQTRTVFEFNNSLA